MEQRLGTTLVNARSLAGVGTTLAFPEWSLTVDLGVCTPAALRTDLVALTHAHADHMSGVAQYLGVRALFGMKPCRFVVPEASEADFRAVIEALGRLQGRPFECTIEAARPGEDIALTTTLWLRPFPVRHNVPANGYVVLRRVRKLKPEFVDLPPQELERLRQDAPDQVFDLVETPLAAVAGDSLAEGVPFNDPLVRSAQTLFLDCTFVDARRTVEHAHLGGHAHLVELVPLLSGLGCEHIVLYHFSQIYRPDEIEAALRAAFPEDFGRRVHCILPVSEDRL